MSLASLARSSSLLLLLSVAACGGGSTEPTDSGAPSRDTGTMDAPSTEFPDAAITPGTDAPISSDDDAFVPGADAFTPVADDDAGMQSDAGRTGTTCGGRGSPPCGRGTFCNFPPSSICGRADGPGTCTPIPSTCTREYAPVCACDGTTYSNACEAARASISIETVGECPVRCDPDLVTCDGIPPRCATGTTASVEGGCWTGDCVAIMECTCETTDDCPDIRGESEVCYTRGVCGPLL
ncbi:MAG: hypothetical protein J0L92_04935 [Deltaproteobacteria bacterium]|nr:hypothetical protein [Deltaproteobacteria bacterium]